ncbi:O-antigen translocase [Lentisphaera marina]|uniref:O-antigen translocase n=1 Tax=Lentisphaera marina TaxID=1111041 RepID=UPI00236501BB|nr:O-antigen translocase [Lentisphaera marina]MDD7986892.1 O-antigen translocase [Lentisphaera marina]
MSNKTYSQILKSTSIIGGAQGINMLIAMIRVKFVSVLIGPAGYGILANFQAILGVAKTLSGLGLNGSAVRDVAEANGKGDQEHIARVVAALKKTCWLSGFFGALLMVALAYPLSQWSFNTHDYTLSIIALSLVIFFGNIQAGRMVIVQGFRRIKDLAILNILGTFVGSIIAVAFYYFMGIDGILPTLIIMAFISLLLSYYFSKKISIREIKLTWRETFTIAKPMLKMGLAMMWSGLLAAVSAYIIRLIITRELGLEAVGIYSAAFALSGYIVNFILSAMGADYYPRLTEVNEDHSRMCELVDQQTEIGLLLATPFIMFGISLAPLLIKIFYTSQFAEAASLLQWFLLGCLGRVIIWPMGITVLAKGKSKLFTCLQTYIHIIHLIMLLNLLPSVGLIATAISFALLYLIHFFVIKFHVKKLITYSWSLKLKKLILSLSISCLSLVLLHTFIINIIASISGTIISLLITIFCLKRLCNLLGAEHKVSILCSKLKIS